MASRIPLVIINGLVQQLPSGDSLNASANEVDVITTTNGDSASLTAGMAVAVKAAGSVQRAVASALVTSRVAGLVKDPTIAASANGNIQTDGVLTLTTTQWDAVTGQTGGLTPGAPYFLDPATLGSITTTAPTTVGQYVTPIGVALSTTEMDLDIQSPIGL